MNEIRFKNRVERIGLTDRRTEAIALLDWLLQYPPPQFYEHLTVTFCVIVLTNIHTQTKGTYKLIHVIAYEQTCQLLIYDIATCVSTTITD